MSNSYLVFFPHSYSHSYKSRSKENLKSAIFSYLHHQHPTYTQEHFDKELKGFGGEERKRMKKKKKKKKKKKGEISLTLRPQASTHSGVGSAAQGRDTLEDMRLSNEGRGLLHT